MQEAWRERRAAGANSPVGYEWSRRMELQAECFSGLFMQSIVDSGGPFTGGELSTVLQAWIGNHAGGPPTHGTNASWDAWFLRGTENQIARCNTYTATAGEVA